MKVSFHFKMFISLRVFVVSITLMQVCLVLRISDDGNLNLQLIGHIRERVISKCGASWQRMRGLASSLIGTPPSRSSVDWNTKRWKMLRLVCILNLGELPPPQGAWNSWEMFLFVTNDWVAVPPAMECAKDTSVSRLQKDWPTVMTSSAQNINTSSGNHWIVINMKNENIGKDDSPHGIPTWRLFFFF